MSDAREKTEELVDAMMAREARSAEVYVLASSVGPSAVSSDLELLKRRAEEKEKWHADEFKWERDPYIGWTERLLLKYMSKSTGRWNKASTFIDKVQDLDAGQARSAG